MHQHIQEIKENPKCTPELRRLLGFIMDNMLVVDPTRRASTEEVVEFFKRDRATSEDTIPSEREGGPNGLLRQIIYLP